MDFLNNKPARPKTLGLPLPSPPSPGETGGTRVVCGGGGQGPRPPVSPGLGGWGGGGGRGSWAGPARFWLGGSIFKKYHI